MSGSMLIPLAKAFGAECGSTSGNAYNDAKKSAEIKDAMNGAGFMRGQVKLRMKWPQWIHALIFKGWAGVHEMGGVHGYVNSVVFVNRPRGARALRGFIP